MGRPSVARIDDNCQNSRDSAQRPSTDSYQLSDINGLYWSSVQLLLTENVRMKRVPVKIIHWDLINNSKERREEPEKLIKVFCQKASLVMNQEAIVTADKLTRPFARYLIKLAIIKYVTIT